MGMKKHEEKLNDVLLRELSDKELLCCIEYVMDRDEDRIAEEIGVSTKEVKRMLRRPPVRKYIHELQEQFAEYTLVTNDYMLEMGQKLFRRTMGMEDVPCGRDEDGKVKYKRQFYPDSAVKMWDALSKTTTIYEEGSNPAGSFDSLADLMLASMRKENEK